MMKIRTRRKGLVAGDRAPGPVPNAVGVRAKGRLEVRCESLAG